MKDVAVSAAKKAGKVLLQEYWRFNRNDARFKSPHEILTRADLLSEEIILKEIKKNFPHHHILAEESGDNKVESEYFWIIDPLDGTTNFFMRNPLWAISIGLAYRDDLILGIIYAPVLGELFIAEKDRAAFLNGQKIKVSDFSGEKALQLFCYGRDEKKRALAVKYFSYQKMHGFDCRQLGSAALELAFTAAGRVESIAMPGANLYDIAAGILLTREAGGRVTDLRNKEWRLDSPDMIASNGKAHKEILEVFSKIS